MIPTTKLNFLFFFAIMAIPQLCLAQTKVAILDFENTSGIQKYDGFGKALSNMLITDLKNSIHPRNMTFLERSQLNKILDEQNLQKSKDFDNTTTITLGKLAGVDFVILGNVFVLDEMTNITARLVNVETSEIEYSKESNGDITQWLFLKSNLAEELSKVLNNPIVIGAEQKSITTTEGVIAEYSKVIDKMDEGDFDSARKLAETLSVVLPNFLYFKEIARDIEVLRKQVEINTSDISSLKRSGGLVYELNTLKDYTNNIGSPLIDIYEKRSLFREAINKFEVSELLKNVPFYRVMQEFVYISDEDVLQIIKDDINFIDELKLDRNKEYFIETVLIVINWKLMSYFHKENYTNSSELEELFEIYMALVSQLYELKKLDELMSIDEFNHINFFTFNFGRDNLAKKILVKHWVKIFNEIKNDMDPLFINQIIETENISEYLLDEKNKYYGGGQYARPYIYSLIEFGVVQRILRKNYPNTPFIEMRKDNSDIEKYLFPRVLVEDFENKLRKKYLLDFSRIYSFIDMGFFEHFKFCDEFDAKCF